jgi:hypothetical protein
MQLHNFGALLSYKRKNTISNLDNLFNKVGNCTYKVSV